MESDDFTRHYIIRYLSTRDLVLLPWYLMNAPGSTEFVVVQLNNAPWGASMISHLLPTPFEHQTGCRSCTVG